MYQKPKIQPINTILTAETHSINKERFSHCNSLAAQERAAESHNSVKSLFGLLMEAEVQQCFESTQGGACLALTFHEGVVCFLLRSLNQLSIKGKSILINCHV